jgi:uncharacterized coiled-coil protein SlyX
MSSARYTDNDLKRVAGIKDEQWHEQLNLMLEGVDTLLDKRLTPIENRLSNLETDMKTVKLVLTETNQDVHALQRDVKILTKRTENLEAFTEDIPSHELRITKLEQLTAQQ